MEASELLRQNAVKIGLIGEKIIVNHLSSLGYQIELAIDPFSYSDLKVLENGVKKKVQVKCLTPYYKMNEWSIKISASSKNIENMIAADRLFIISLPKPNTSKFKIVGHETDGTILEVYIDKLHHEINMDYDRMVFFIHRDKHKHTYDIVRILTQEELYIIEKFPTTNLSI
jgi:hypothetical protein